MKKTALFASLTAAACAAPQKVVESGSVQVAVDRIMPLAESLDASAVEVTLRLRNSTGDAVSIESVAYEINTADVGGKLSGTAEGGATIEPQQEAELKFRQSIRFPEDKDAYKAVIDRSTIPVELTGSVKLSSGESVSFARSSEVATPSLPKFVVHEAQAARYGKAGVDVTLFLRLINENVFPVQIGSVNYTVEVGGKKVKSEQAAIGQRMLASAAEEYEVGSVLDEQSFDKEQIQKMVADRKVTYRVHGTVELARLTIPFEYDGEIELATGE